MNKSLRALLLDLSGVLYEGSEAIAGSAETIAEARRRKLILRFVTNTATQCADSIRAKLASMGIDIADEELFTAPRAALAYIRQHQLRPFCLLHRALHEEFSSVDQHDPNCVLLGDARDDLNYRNLNRAFRLCKAGAPLIGIGMNKYFRDDDGLKLDAGGFVHLLEWAADVNATVMGKPSEDFFAQVVASTGVPAQHCLMVGDDVRCDVIAAIDAGLQARLVRTGKYQPADEAQLPASGLVLDSIADLFA